MKWLFWLYNKSGIKMPEILPVASTNLNSTVIFPEESGLVPQ